MRSNSIKFAAALAAYVLTNTTLVFAADKPVVQAANYPLAFFAEQIGGDLIEVKFLAPADGDPAFWTPSVDQVAEIQSADILLLNGAEYSKWLPKFSLPESILIDTSAAFKGEYITVKGATTHTHGDGKSHAHDGIAFTTWMDLQQSIWQAEAVRDALIGLLPGEEKSIKKNFDALATEIEVIHNDFKSVGESLSGTPLVASHPVYQYFSRRYDLSIESVHWEPETVPDSAAMEELGKILKDHPAKWMIWEGEPAEESVAKLDAMGIQSIVIDPAGNRPDKGDWLSVMRENVAQLKKIRS